MLDSLLIDAPPLCDWVLPGGSATAAASREQLDIANTCLGGSAVVALAALTIDPIGRVDFPGRLFKVEKSCPRFGVFGWWGLEALTPFIVDG